MENFECYIYLIVFLKMLTIMLQDLSLESKEWEATGAEVDKLFIYPMKSAKGISLDEANVRIFFLITSLHSL